jgi:hypothetical protein
VASALSRSQVWFEIQPSATVKQISWLSLTAVSTAVACGFTYLFIGGYI